jgi:hypothetical protein
MRSSVGALRTIVDDARASPEGYAFDWPTCIGLSCVNHEQFKAKASRKLALHMGADTITTHFPRGDGRPDPEFDEALATRIEEAQIDLTQTWPAEEEVVGDLRRSKRLKTGAGPDYGGRSATQIARAREKAADEAASA